MLKVYFLQLLLLLTFQVHSQDCSNLIISEIVFGTSTFSSDFGTELDVENFSVELFNPTQSAINLDKFVIALFENQNSVERVRLGGIIQPSGTYVATFRVHR